MSLQFTIIGLNEIGSSIGLILGRKKPDIHRVGNDRQPNIARTAQKAGAIDKVTFNLPAAVENADAVILAVPTDEIHPTMEVIAPELKEGAVLIDTSPLKAAATAWAEELLPQERHFVSITPTLNPAYLYGVQPGTDLAQADLFENSMMVITTPMGTHQDAIKLATDLVELLGATPLFADIMESDGLMTYCHSLPQVIAAAFITSVTNQPGWIEGRKLGGRGFALATAPLLYLDGMDSIGKEILHNRDNVLRIIDNLTGALNNLRSLIEDEDEQALHEYLKQAKDARILWQVRREKADWDDQSSPMSEIPTTGQALGRMIFGKLGEKREKKGRKR